MSQTTYRDINRRKRLVDRVSHLGVTEHEQILRILYNHGLRYTKNNNGVFCDMTKVPDEVLDVIEQFIDYSIQSNALLSDAAMQAGDNDKNKKSDVSDVAMAPPPMVKTERVKTFSNSFAKVKTESNATKRKDACRYQQLKKKYSRPVTYKSVCGNDLRIEHGDA
jgi:hypothetical protein